MAKRAFCVGINDYPYDGSDLNGCVNDARAWATLLTEHFDVARPDVRVTSRGTTKRCAPMTSGTKFSATTSFASFSPTCPKASTSP